MDSQDYLNQIAESSKPPAKSSKGGLSNVFSSKYFKWGMGALVALVLIMVVGMLIGSKPSQESKCTDLKLRVDRTITVMDQYQPLVKSSVLRSLSASLKGVFANTASQLNNYMIQTYAFDEGKVKEAVVLEADTNRDALLNDLFEAKVNGFLDRTYVHKMATEIYTVMSNEAAIINSSGDAELNAILRTSYDSLNNLYPQFNDFSETKQTTN